MDYTSANPPAAISFSHPATLRLRLSVIYLIIGVGARHSHGRKRELRTAPGACARESARMDHTRAGWAATEKPMKRGAAIGSFLRGVPKIRSGATWQAGTWARVRRAAAALVLVYLMVGVAIPWLLVEAPPLPYVVAAAPEHCNHPQPSADPCRAPDHNR